MSENHEAGQLDMLPGLRDSLRATVEEARTRASRSEKKRRADEEPAERDPVAQVLVDVPLAHLDRPFDYLVPAKLDETCQPGVRVKVRFAGQDVDGFVVSRTAESSHPGRLTPVRRVVGTEPVLTPEVAELTGLVASRYAGARSDVLRLAVPPRHATAEAAVPPAGESTEDESHGPSYGPSYDASAAATAWSHHEHGPAFLSHLAAGESPRAVWQAVPGTDWPMLLAHAAAAAAASGRGAVICVPHHRDVARVSAALAEVAGTDSHVVLTADQGPAARWTAFVQVLRGHRRIVVGARSAAFAPVRNLGLVAVWDDGDELHSEPRAPYPHTREVLLTRAESLGAAVLVGGFTRTVESEYLVRTGWARSIAGSRETVRRAALVDAHWLQDRSAATRIPQRVVQLMKQALTQGPVLVQVPRSGYVPSLACERCRTSARCRGCTGPLELGSATEPPACRWCGTPDPVWRCPECGHAGLRAPVLGRDRTAEELGRLLPGVVVRSSGGDRVVDALPAVDGSVRPVLVVATPGAEPHAPGGYAAVVLLDVWLQLGRVELRADEEVLRRWLNAAGLVAPGGRVAVVGDPALPVVQALVRWDPAGFAARELDVRVETHLPPAVRMATVTGEPAAVEEALGLVEMPDVVEVLGPVPVDGRDGESEARYVLRVPRASGATLSEALGAMQRARSARNAVAVKVRVDPYSL